MKKCNKCLNIFELTLFHVKKSSKDGYNNICKNCKKEINKNFYENNKESKIEYQKRYRDLNKDRVDFYKKEYNKTYSPQYYLLNKEKKLAYNHEYQTKKLKDNPKFKLTKLLRTRFHHALIKGKKIKSIIDILGCSVETCKKYIKSQFYPEMTWENHGKIWEIDHIKPCSSFDLTKIDEQQKCFHYTNLQPMFKTSEIAKSFGYVDEIGNRNKWKK